MLSIGRPVPYNVVPAQAGVILIPPVVTFPAFCGPRTGGGDPVVIPNTTYEEWWSPHRRG